MGHICPNCFEPAPVLFGICPECDKKYPKECTNNKCNHCYSTRDEMIMKRIKTTKGDK